MKPILRGRTAPHGESSITRSETQPSSGSVILFGGMAASASEPDLLGDAVDLSAPREIKIKLPISIHVKLQSLKIAKGKQISKVVLEALEAYFKTVDEEKQHR